MLMKDFFNMRKSKLLLLTLLACFAGGVSPAWAEEVTVYDGTANNQYLPVYGYYADTKGTTSEFIIPSGDLTALNGKTIEKMIFYLQSPAAASWGGSFNVYLEEVLAANYDDSSASQLTDSKTTVYTGALDGTGTTMEIPFTTNYTYNGGNLLVAIEVGTVGTYKAANFYGTTTSSNTGRCSKLSSPRQKFIPKTTFVTPTNGPALEVKDGSKKLASPYSCDFGLALAGATKSFTLSNPGTEAVKGLSVSETGDFGATLSATTIAAGGEATLTVTMPEATGNSEITLSSTTVGIKDFVINASGTIRDAKKVYLDFADGQMPDGWTSVKVGSWAADWTVGTGYIGQSNSQNYTTTNYDAAFTSPKLVFNEDETILFESARYNNNTYASYVKVQYSTDGSTWTDCSSNYTDNIYGTWTQRSATVPTSDAKYIRFYGKNVYLRNIYGGELPHEPKMAVTEPTSLDFGAISEPTDKTFTISNTGLATLNGITVTSSNSTAFVISNAPASLEAGASQEVTITMSSETVGNLSSIITVSATDMEDVQFTVTGTVLPTDLSVIDFNDNALPARWENTGWSFSDGAAYAAYNSNPYTMTTPKIIVEEDDLFVIKAKLRYSGSFCYVTINGSSDNGETWTAYTKQLSSELNTEDYTAILLSDIPSTVNRLQFVGYYGYIDEIQGINYAPTLAVTKDTETVTSPTDYDFGECGADATVTYNFTNAGAGTINITNVEITGGGAAAYSTNWTESVAVPFALTITRAYDADRTEAQEAVVTVTTSDGEFVINVTGTDKAANAPELAVTLGGEAVSTGAAANFGTKLQAAPEAKTYTITNSGTGTLTGTIATSDDTQFTVSETEFTLGAAESTTFDLALVFDENYGAKAATITIHPTVDGLEDIVINATASTLDPEAWTEDFSEGTLPTGWTQGTWTIGTYSSYENTTAMALAPSGSTAGTLISPCLSAKAGEVLTWDGYFNWYDEAMTVEYSNDNQETWAKIYDAYKAQTDFGYIRYTHKEMSFTAPADGDYYLRFTSTYSNGVDNFAGFKLNLPDHIMAITTSNIPTSGSYSPTMKATKSFEATVTVQESRGVDEENVVAKLYMGEEVIGTSETTTVEAGETKQIAIVCTPTVAATEGAEMHIEVEWAGTTLTTEAVTRYVAEFVRLDLTETTEEEIETGYSAYDQVTLTRSFVAGWNTFVAPQAVNMSEFGKGAKAYSFTGYADGNLSFTAVNSSTLNPATPYIIYVLTDIDEKVFTWESPVIYSTYVGAENIKTTQNSATFQGTYAPIAAPGMEGLWGVTDEAKIAKGTDKASIKGFRAYFELPDGANAARITFFNEDGTTTSIMSTELDKQDAENIYNLQGQKVTKTSKAGLYIKNGKKVIVK